jgi:hypothetical protein
LSSFSPTLKALPLGFFGLIGLIGLIGEHSAWFVALKAGVFAQRGTGGKAELRFS